MRQPMGGQGRRRRVLAAVVLGCSALMALASAFVPASAVQKEPGASRLALAAPAVTVPPVTVPPASGPSVTVPPVTIPPPTVSAPVTIPPAGR